MKISETIETIINRQIQEEFQSAFIYLAMAAFFDSRDLPGFAHWMRKQYSEETEHALKMYHFITERDGEVVIPGISKVEATWKNALDALETTYKHEQHITSCIYKIIEAARKEGDLATENFFQWFVKEQVEEEAHALEILKILRKAQDNLQIIMPLDRQLGER